MKIKRLTKTLVAALLAIPLFSGIANAYELTIPTLDYRTGPYGPNGIPFANGYSDYMTMLNERDGGINDARINLVACETAYNTKRGVECYESTKGEGESGALVYQPLSTGITYQLIPKSSVDEIPIFSMGYGRTSAANGKIFPWVFNFPATYWSQATIFVQYIAEQEGGMNKLKGKKIALVYHNSAYGKEPIRTLEAAAKKFGFELMLLPVDHPGQEQKSTWLQVRKERPDWVMMWGWGVMNQVAIKEASSIRFPMNRFLGVWWSGSENDVIPAGKGAHGYLSGAFHAPGDKFPAHDDIKKYVYDAGKGFGDRDRIGEVLYNRGLVAAMWTSEAIRNAMKIHGTNEVNGKMVRDGFESLDVDEARLKELGLPGFTIPVKITCENHEGPGQAAIQQWDANAKRWNFVTDFYEPLRDITGPLIAEDSAQYAAENNVTPAKCN
ncbi:MAG: branched-chain amino acid transport system substrate-binding protein [Planctomycetota bacterium]|jgi:branched-chain amino acid transport system substrate-binding protein